MIVTVRLLMVSLALLAFSPATRAAEPDRLFREQVAPIFEQRCVRCHGARSPKGGLSLVTGEGLRRGGETGPAIVPGNPDESLLIDMISGDKPQMPWKDAPLTKAQVESLRRWIQHGAAWPEGATLVERRHHDAIWWSLRPLVRPEIPAVHDRRSVRSPIDAFILSKLEAAGLHLSPEANRRTLIRRLTFGLHGLPPTPEDIQQFLADRDPDAYEKLVDRLLASPRYGERWGRHWLDVVHYGDTHGYDKDKRRDHAWRYRDYVIRSLNEDVPYSRFIREQLAGDVSEPRNPRSVIATGFIAAGPWDFVGHVELGERTIEKQKTRAIDRDDMVANTMSTFVSLTVHCARCHDHKFDPIPQRDYYRLQAVFAGIDRGDRPCSIPDARIKGRPSTEMVYAVLSHAPRPIFVLPRGDVEHPALAVGPGALSCVHGLDLNFPNSNTDGEGARRAALAAWIASPANMLTWRSIVNRLWHYHFGRGLVDTPNDFGRNGSTPTHPELLDWLAVRFRDGGQGFKAIHRLIVTSETYRQSSHNNHAFSMIDADNRRLWRMSRQRLDAEAVRDSVLAASGTLDSAMGGPGFELFRFKDDHSPIYDHTPAEAIDNPRVRRRTIYRFVVRSVPNPFLECMDSPDPSLSAPVRGTTITALQALALLNDVFMVNQSHAFARRLAAQGGDLRRQIEAAFVLTLGRPPSESERDALTAYAQKHGLFNACRILFNTNEFLFID
jgi:mono/diheme cytochrome c family protein